MNGTQWSTLFFKFIILVVIQFCFYFQTNAQEIDTKTKASAKNGYHLALEEADIKDLVRWTGEQTGKNIVLHPDVKGKVTVMANSGMSAEEAHRVFLSVLQVHGLSAIEDDGVLQVVPTEIASQSDIPFLSDSASASALKTDMIVRIIKVKNVAAAEVVSLIRPLMSKGAVVNAYPDSNLLIVADQAARISRLIQIVNRIDIAGLIDIELIPLEFARSQDVIQLLNRLVPALVSGPDKNSTAFTVADDPRSNSILMTGDPIVRAQLRALIKKLDTPVNGDSHTQVVFINYAKAASLLPALESVSGSLQQADRDQKYANMDIKIVVNEDNNALVITAPPALHETIRSVIRQLDVRRSQVLVEALIVEVNDELMRDIGVRWRSVLNNDDVFVGSNTLGTLGGATPPNLAEGLTLGFYSNKQLRGLLRALESDSDSNVLSSPTIVALDNKEAEILVGSNVPFITGSSTGSSSSTDNPFQTIQRKDIGVTLKVKPHINNDGSITLEIEQSVESISPSRASDIITNKRRIKTEVLIENDEVLVLGGLITDELNESEERVPLLGRIPLLGRAFKSNKRQVNKRNLMVFIHPRILDSRAQNDAITRDKYNGIQGLQQQFNKHHSLFRVPKGPLLDAMPAVEASE